MERGKRMRRWIARVGAGVVLPLLLLAAGGPGAAADEPDMTVAEALLASAQDQLKKRHYDAALSLVEKTLAEAPTFLPALELKGVVLEKLARPAEATEAYRAWVEAYGAHSAAGTLARGAARKKKTIDKRLERLTQGVRDLAAIEGALRDDLTSFAKRWAEAAPAAVSRATSVLEALAALEAPGEEEASPEGTLSRVFRELAPASEVDLIARKSLGSPDGITYLDEGGMLLSYADGGTIVQPVEKIRTGEAYVLELHFDPAPKSHRWLTGLVFGVEGSLRSFFAAFVKDGKLILHRVSDEGSRKEDVAVQRVSVRPGRRSTLAVVVQKLAIEVYVNGKKKVSYTAPRSHDLTGGIGVWAQDAVVKVPVLMLGRLAP